MIAGLEKSLCVLDVSNNNLLTLDPALFRSLTSLQELKALGNNIESFSVPDFIGSVLRVQIGGGPQINRQTVLRDLSKSVL